MTKKCTQHGTADNYQPFSPTSKADSQKADNYGCVCSLLRKEQNQFEILNISDYSYNISDNRNYEKFLRAIPRLSKIAN